MSGLGAVIKTLIWKLLKHFISSSTTVIFHNHKPPSSSITHISDKDKMPSFHALSPSSLSNNHVNWKYQKGHWLKHLFCSLASLVFFFFF